jgi:hypothetical protein
MRLPRFRFTIRAFMIAIAATTFLVVGGIQARKWLEWREVCLYVAGDHARRESEQRQKLADAATARSEGFKGWGDRRAEADTIVPMIEDLARARLDFHARMRLKWEHAARRPWQDVADDPKEPTDERIEKTVELGPLPYFRDDVQYFVPDPPPAPEAPADLKRIVNGPNEIQRSDR